MFKELRVKHPRKTYLLALLVSLMMFFVAYKMWHEYQIYLANKMIEDYPTAAGPDAQLSISWDDNADNEAGYRIERKVDGEFLLVATVAANETTYTESISDWQDAYCYRIGAFNSVGSAYSDESCIDSEIIEPQEPNQSSYAILYDVDMYSGKVIDVSDVKYMPSQGAIGNERLSEVQVNKLEYNGNFRYRDRGYRIVSDGVLITKGNTRMGWNESNSVLMSLKNPNDSSISNVSLYFRAIAQTEEPASIALIINNELNLIELTEQSTWMRIRADIEFQGEVSIELSPVGKFAKSKIDRRSNRGRTETQ